MSRLFPSASAGIFILISEEKHAHTKETHRKTGLRALCSSSDIYGKHHLCIITAFDVLLYKKIVAASKHPRFPNWVYNNIIKASI